MKTIAKISWISLGIILISTLISCDKDVVLFPPEVKTHQVHNITCFTAKCDAEVLNNGGKTLKERGVCFSTSPQPTIENSKIKWGIDEGTYTITIGLLNPQTNYFACGYATNKEYSAYGEVIEFTTPSDEIIFNNSLEYGSVTDIDGNVYKTIKIGNQTWMAENLRVTRFNNGDAIKYLDTDNYQFGASLHPTYAWLYHEKNTLGKTFGALYNWYALDTFAICPEGWRVPSENDWKNLFVPQGGSSDAANSLKEKGMTHWNFQQYEPTNASGFTALPGGGFNRFGAFTSFGAYGYWWSSTATETGAIKYNMYNDSRTVYKYDVDKSYGFSVRCIKDQ